MIDKPDKQSDIVDELRAANATLCAEAADEIERLRVRVMLKEETVDRLQARRAELVAWLLDHDREIVNRKDHLEPGSKERSYWQFGYLSCLNDLLYLLGK
jgi:hypothetical protein